MLQRREHWWEFNAIVREQQQQQLQLYHLH